MREALRAMWQTIIVLFTGIESFANAFKAVGDVAEDSAINFRDEEKSRYAIKNEQLKKEYLSLQKP